MKKLIKICILLVFIIAAPEPVFADLKVQVARESELPVSLSSQNPINSPTASNNSINNSINSASNPNNLSSSPGNDPSSTENGMKGNRRMLFEKDGAYYFIGYFVLTENRLINFFSPYGKRVFYTPPGSDALFGSVDGEFCGALATANNKTVLMLTEKGELALKKEGIPPFSPSDTNIQKTITGIYDDGESEHQIQSNYNGSTIVLDDGSIWEIDQVDVMITALWKYEAVISVSSAGGGKYEYTLSNSEDGKNVRAKYLGKK